MTHEVSPGTQLGAYELIELVGAGGMGARGRASEHRESSQSAWGWGLARSGRS